jgi:CheY-like chemotaxis protein
MDVNTRPHRVVVAEADAELRESLKDLLHEEGYEVFAVHDPSEALALLAEGHAPCVLVLDLRHDAAAGWTMLARLAQFPDALRPHHVIAVGDASNAKVVEKRFGCRVINQFTAPTTLFPPHPSALSATNLKP